MNQLNRDDLRVRVDESVKVIKRNSRIGMFIANLIMFIIFMAITWGAALSTSQFQAALADSHSTLMTVLILPTIGWGTAVFLQFMALIMDFGLMDRQFRDRAFASALREQLFEETVEKVKNQPLEPHIQADEPAVQVRLSDDGELVPIERAAYKASGKGTAP